MHKIAQKNTVIRLLAGFVICAAFFALFTQAVMAADAGFSVKAVLPENQADISSTYFNLSMSPGQRQNLKIDIFNESGEEITVNVSSVSASTSRHGVIDYVTPGVKDETLKVPFADISEIITPVIQIPVGKSATANVQVVMPEEEFDGIVLGGIVLTRAGAVDNESESGDSGMSLTNKYSYVIAVKLIETEKEVPPDFEFVSAGVETVNYRTAVVNYLRNREAAIAKDVKMDLSVARKSDNAVILQEEGRLIEMAPNSVMAYALEWGAKPLESGTYVSSAHMEQGEKKWDFKQEFTIDGQNVKELNERPMDTEGQHNWICWLLLILIVLLLVLIWLLFKRKKRDEDEKGH